MGLAQNLLLENIKTSNSIVLFKTIFCGTILSFISNPLRIDYTQCQSCPRENWSFEHFNLEQFFSEKLYATLIYNFSYYTLSFLFFTFHSLYKREGKKWLSNYFFLIPRKLKVLFSLKVEKGSKQLLPKRVFNFKFHKLPN